ncbi:hypothetical protein KEM54_000583 [Ascosphaera aggregata]|nr:hypothetical protein KEM54_000583 [Ascosphaera aggregata]
MAVKRSILLTLDALDTIYYPRLPIARQYLEVARNHNLPLPPDASESKLRNEFYKAFKAEEAKHPIYGYYDAQRGLHSGPREWWGDVIKSCLRGVMRQPSDTKDEEKQEASCDCEEVPEALIEELYERFNCGQAYALYEDVVPFFTQIQALRKSMNETSKLQGLTRRNYLYVAVVSNSDGRVDNIMRTFGLQVGDIRKASENKDALTHARDSSDDIDYVLTSYDVGYEKPHPKIFEFAADIAASPQKMEDCRNQWFLVHVGDHYRKDGEGATLAGWDKSLILQREARIDPLQCDKNLPIAHIRSLLDVLPLLKAAIGQD